MNLIEENYKVILILKYFLFFSAAFLIFFRQAFNSLNMFAEFKKIFIFIKASKNFLLIRNFYLIFSSLSLFLILLFIILSICLFLYPFFHSLMN